MAETFVAILAAHLLGNFICPATRMVKQKQRAGLLLHVFIVTAASFLLLGNFYWLPLLVIFLTHLGMDALKVFVLKDSLSSFLVGLSVHIAVIVVLAYLFPDTASVGWWNTVLNGELWNWYFVSLSFLSGLILAVPAGGILIGKATSRFMAEIGDDNIAGLEKGGQYIGWLERFLVMLLLLINQPTGIGFLIAAKSILRFGEIKDASQRKVAEYIIIGTFLSFGWALLISVLTQNAIQHWLRTSPPESPTIKVIIEESP